MVKIELKAANIPIDCDSCKHEFSVDVDGGELRTFNLMMVWTLLPTKHAESCYIVGGNVSRAGVKHEPYIFNFNEFSHYWH